ncbi:hypothetical protein COCON_G00128290 [Conger conger]|uniref:Uncharacterized protein n=1 Tax=Conger conger TaxID=82655 RepID=A0A9Q1HX05_CONCO|nr:hypothetical protein COCON_G00128290 [Conger conger]
MCVPGTVVGCCECLTGGAFGSRMNGGTLLARLALWAHCCVTVESGADVLHLCERHKARAQESLSDPCPRPRRIRTLGFVRSPAERLPINSVARYAETGPAKAVVGVPAVSPPHYSRCSNTPVSLWLADE